MKYIKLYENENKWNKVHGSLPEIDDYVILQTNNIVTNSAFINFLNTNIGQIFNIFPADNNKTKYIVQYEYVPPEFESKFTIRNYKDDTTEYFAENVTRNNIAYYSQNKEDIQMYVDAAKYNL